MHDVVEDCIGWTFERLREEGFSNAVVAAVDSVTVREEEKHHYQAFIQRAGRNPIGRRVKIADLNDNLDLSRIANPTERDFERLAKYRRALAVLTAAPDSHHREGRQCQV